MILKRLNWKAMSTYGEGGGECMDFLAQILLKGVNQENLTISIAIMLWTKS